MEDWKYEMKDLDIEVHRMKNIHTYEELDVYLLYNLNKIIVFSHMDNHTETYEDILLQKETRYALESVIHRFRNKETMMCPSSEG